MPARQCLNAAARITVKRVTRSVPGKPPQVVDKIVAAPRDPRDNPKDRIDMKVKVTG